MGDGAPEDEKRETESGISAATCQPRPLGAFSCARLLFRVMLNDVYVALFHSGRSQRKMLCMLVSPKKRGSLLILHTLHVFCKLLFPEERVHVFLGYAEQQRLFVTAEFFKTLSTADRLPLTSIMKWWRECAPLPPAQTLSKCTLGKMDSSYRFLSRWSTFCFQSSGITIAI